VTKINLLVDV